MTCKKLKTIAVSEENYTELQNRGKAGMSFNDVLNELLKDAKIKSMQANSRLART